ncbi:MAG: TRAP-T-associated universal stress protein TeaD [Anaerolineae bacterium]|nr:TRAP-T-associated universal stress protein TeaD [Anaerolineae bacterium]
MFKRLLVPVDGSVYSNQAVAAAVNLARQYQSSVWLLHVIRHLSLPAEILAMIAAGEVTESRQEILENSAEIILENAKKQFESAGVTSVHTEYVFGTPSKQITDYAVSHNIDLIIIGQRGVSSEDENMLGGVARKLTNIAKTSCLIIK